MEPLTMMQEMCLKNHHLAHPINEPFPWLAWALSWKDRFYLRHYLQAAWWVLVYRQRRGKK